MTSATKLSTSVLSLTAVLVALGSCSVATLDKASEAVHDPDQTNSCRNDLDCRSEQSGAASCGPGFCVSGTGQLHAALINIIPPASAFFGAGDSFLVSANELSFGDWSRKILLPQYARITGEVRIGHAVLTDPVDESCAKLMNPQTGSLAVHVELERWEKRLGLGTSVYTADATKTGADWRFSLNIPPGKYDVRVYPPEACANVIPPMLTEAQIFDSGAVSFEQAVDSVSSLTGTVKGLDTSSGSSNGRINLDGWRVTVVDTTFGSIISTRSQLGSSSSPKFSLRYQPTAKQTPGLLKLAPPADAVAPTFLWDLSVLDLDGDGRVGLNLDGVDLSVIHVKGRVLNPQLAPAGNVNVKFHSSSLRGIPQGLRAWYQTEVVSSTDGVVELDLLPGVYRVTATPNESDTAGITLTEWKIASKPAMQAGKTISLELPHTIRGRLLSPRAVPLANVKMTTSPYFVGSHDYATTALSPRPRPPRSSSDTTLGDGSFALTSDTGMVTLTARMSRASQFPWLVSVPIDTTVGGLGDVFVPFPVPLAGVLEDPHGNLVQQANIRVFALMDSETGTAAETAETADSVVLVAEAQTETNGRFRLLLPAHIFTETR